MHIIFSLIVPGSPLIGTFFKCRKVSKKQDFIVLVLLSAHAERVGVSRMRVFFITLVGFSVGFYLLSVGPFYVTGD